MLFNFLLFLKERKSWPDPCPDVPASSSDESAKIGPLIGPWVRFRICSLLGRLLLLLIGGTERQADGGQLMLAAAAAEVILFEVEIEEVSSILILFLHSVCDIDCPETGKATDEVEKEEVRIEESVAIPEAAFFLSETFVFFFSIGVTSVQYRGSSRIEVEKGV